MTEEIARTKRSNAFVRVPAREIPEDGLKDASGVRQRWLSIAEVMTYTGLSRSSVAKLGEAAGCVRHFGRRVLFDRLAVDQYLDNQK